MARNKETLDTWNKVALLYQEKMMDLDLYNETYDFICNSIAKKNAELLEIGCGPGNITKYILSKRPDFHIQGIDLSPNMIELAIKNNPAANFRVMDCRNIENMKSKFDGIICGFCLPYLSEAESEKLIVDAKNLLNAGATIYISFIEGTPAQSGFQVGSTDDRSYFYYHNLERLKTHIIENSFEEFNIFKVAYKKLKIQQDIHTILTARKK